MPAFWGYPLPPHDYPYLWFIIGSQVKTRQSQSYKFKEFAKTSFFFVLKNPYMRHIFWTCSIYEMDPYRADTILSTDGQTDYRTAGHLYYIFDISIRWSSMHRILLRHIYVVIFLQLFILIGSFHLLQLIVFNSADLLIIPLGFQHNPSQYDLPKI